MKQILLLLALLVFGHTRSAQAAPIVRVQLQVEPGTHAFTCRYTFTLPASDTASTIQLNLSRSLHLQQVQSAKALQQRITRIYYSFFGDTLQRLDLRYAPGKRKDRQVTLVYSGTLGKQLATDQVMVFSGHSQWLPFRSYREYELVDYELNVRVPPGQQVLSTTPVRRQRGGEWQFRGRTSLIEITALVGQQFQQLTSASPPLVTVSKAGAALNRRDTTVLRKAEEIIAFYNRGIGRREPIARFTTFLPGTNSDGFGLRDNATVITYSDFDLAKREDLLILAHEISHKWWNYGSVHDENDWLNEAFATYSSLLYVQAAGDTTAYREELVRLAKTTANTPAILGFDRNKYEPSMYRKVMYNKGTGVLAALHARLGTERFVDLMATTAARKVSTTAAFLDVVEQTAGKDTRAWLLGELSR
jgi:hypothetical protein